VFDIIYEKVLFDMKFKSLTVLIGVALLFGFAPPLDKVKIYYIPDFEEGAVYYSTQKKRGYMRTDNYVVRIYGLQNEKDTSKQFFDVKVEKRNCNKSKRRKKVKKGTIIAVGKYVTTNFFDTFTSFTRDTSYQKLAKRLERCDTWCFYDCKGKLRKTEYYKDNKLKDVRK